MNVGILGSGAGGTAMAFEISKKGFNVIISDLPDFLENVSAIKSQGGVYSVLNDNKEFAKVEAVDTVEEVLKKSEIIFIVTPAFGTKIFAHACKDFIRKGQKFIICPGSSGGALEFKKEAGIHLLDEDIVVGETHTLPYAVRIVKPGSVAIYLYVKTLVFTALPSCKIEEISGLANKIWPDVALPGKNVLETTLLNGNPIIHPTTTLLNAAHIQRTKGDFRFYADGVTKGVANLMKCLDDERLLLAKALDLELPTEPEMSNKEGYIEDNKVNYREGYKQSKVFENIMAPDTLDFRFFNEDVGYSIVLWSSLGELIGIRTPVMDSIITMASSVIGKDYKAMGLRTAETLGLTNELLNQI